ncbi:MAG: TetR family transcriptional regulator [Actinobacteria bacterium]|nr:TetR family transcriptional regulator [Actinomycetota bacterium]
MYPENLGMCQPFPMSNRGRPPLISDEAILEGALSAFAASGFSAMSVRALNADLGLSHETISKRFGPKIELFRAAVGFGVAQFVADFDNEMRATGDSGSTDDLVVLRRSVRALMVAMSRNHALGELLHHGGIDESERVVLLGGSGLGDRLAERVALLDRLHAAGIIRETRIRDLWFLAQGAVAPLHFRELSKTFDPFDGPIEADEHIDRMTGAIMRSMGVEDYPVL